MSPIKSDQCTSDFLLPPAVVKVMFWVMFVCLSTGESPCDHYLNIYTGEEITNANPYRHLLAFSQIDKIDNNGKIGIRGFTSWKKSSDKMLPPVGIEPGPLITSDSKSNTILSTLTWHLLARLRLLVPYIVMLYWFSLNHPSLNIKWCMNRSLKIS